MTMTLRLLRLPLSLLMAVMRSSTLYLISTKLIGMCTRMPKEPK
jgi:hypothetical protein